MDNSDIAKALDTAVKYYGMKVNEFLSSKKTEYPSGQDAYRKNYKPIQDTMKISPVETKNDGYSQTISYGGRDAPYAAAYEFGTPEYEIPSKGIPMAVGKAGVLRTKGGWKPVDRRAVFASKKFRGAFNMDEEEIYLFSTVTHPAFKGKPFVQVVLSQEQNNIAKIVGENIFKSLKVEIDKL